MKPRGMKLICGKTWFIAEQDWLTVFAALAGFIRTIIVANTNEGLDAARACGQRLGRPPAFTPEKIAYALALLAEPDRSMGSIAKLLGVSRAMLYQHLPELKAAAAAPSQALCELAG